MKRNNNKGFTLAELLIVVAVIAVLVAVAIPTFTGQLEKSRQSVDVSNMRAAYAQAKLLVINQDDGNSPFKASLDKVKKGQGLTTGEKTVYFWYNKDTNSLEKESTLTATTFDNTGKLSTTAPDAENYRIGKALTSKLIANIDDFAEKSHLDYVGGTEDTATLPTINKGILVTFKYDETDTNPTYQTFQLDKITFSDKKQSTAGTIQDLTVTKSDLDNAALPTTVYQGKKIDTTQIKVVATYSDNSEVELSDYKFGYSNTGNRKKVSQLINSENLIDNDAVIPEGVPEGCSIYVVDSEGLVMKPLGTATVAKTIKEITKEGTVTVNTTNKTITGADTGSGDTEGLFKVTYTSGDPVYVKAADIGDDNGKYSYKLSFDGSITDPSDPGFDTFTSGSTELLDAYNVYVYYKDSNGIEIVKNLGKVSILKS